MQTSSSQTYVGPHLLPKPSYLNTQKFQLAVKNIPDSDINYITEHAGDNGLTKEEIAQMLAIQRWNNPICEFCLDKKIPKNLKKCTGCYLAFYCGEQCQRADWSRHRQRCQKKDGPLDQGPQRLVLSEPPQNWVELNDCKPGSEFALYVDK